MFEILTENLKPAFKNLRGQGKLSEEHLDAGLAEIREALLEGDVNVGVADEFVAHVRAKAVGSEVLLQLSPDQQVVKIVRDELGELLGKEAKPQYSSKPPSVWMIVGLQGSGKTTSTGKMGKWLAEHDHTPHPPPPPRRGGAAGGGGGEKNPPQKERGGGAPPPPPPPPFSPPPCSP